ncbi:MAG: AAC(3) family N-acetyltransferase [Firmicutes bacterium]|nr:AAC(3) family N-acetyltransferase [Bacillota bacterium]
MRLLRRIKKDLPLYVSQIIGKSISERDIIQCLLGQGFSKGDKIMVHSSLSSIGLVNGGARTIISALQSVVGENGLLVMPTFPAERGNYEYVIKNSVFSCQNTPSRMGIITEIFRTTHGVYRSIHPTHSLAAWGKDAEKFVQGHDKGNTLFGFGTPFEKILNSNFKVLLIGVNFENMTICRIIEDLEPDLYIDPYLSKTFPIKIINKDNTQKIMHIKVHNPEISKKRKNMILYPYLKENGGVKEFKLGQASCMWVYTAEVYEMQKRLAQSEVYTYNL